VYFYGEQSIVSTESSKGGNQSFLSAIEIIAAVAVVAVVAGSSKDASSSATSKSSPTFLAIRLDFLASKSLAFN
jgi:hypothetical protein